MSVVASDDTSSQHHPRTGRDPQAAAQPLLALLRDHAEATFLLDRTGDVVLAGGAVRGLLGYEGGSLVGRPLAALIHPHDLAALDALMQDPHTSAASDTTLRFTQQDRTGTLSLAVRAVPVVMAAGTASLLLTARERATSAAIQAALRREVARMASFAEQSPFAVFLLDGRGRCVAMNTAWEPLSGQPPAEALGLGWLQLIAPPDRAAFRDAAAAAHRAHIGWRQTFRINRPDTRSVTIDAGAAPIVDHDGTVAGYVGVLVDVTVLGETIGVPDTDGLCDAFDAAWTSTADSGRTSASSRGTDFATPEEFSPRRPPTLDFDADPHWTPASPTTKQMAAIQHDTIQHDTVQQLAQPQQHRPTPAAPVQPGPQYASTQPPSWPHDESSLEMSLGRILGTERNDAPTTAIEEADLPLQRPMPSSYGEEPGADPVTGLGNYASFQLSVDEAFQRVTNDGVAMLCIRVALVGFDSVRARLGDKVADDYLYVLGKRVASIIRAVDAAARIEGEEFAILSVGWFFPGDIETVVTRFLRRLGEPLPSKAGDECFGPSIGVALLEPGDTQLTLMRRATRAQARALAIGPHHALIDNGSGAEDTII